MNNKLMLKLSFLLVFICSGVFAGIYDDTQSKNKFLDGEFEEIIRFDALLFDESYKMTSESKNNLKEISKKIKRYIVDGKKVHITILGHTNRPTDDFNELKAASDTYAAKIENVFRYSLDSNQSDKLSKNYAQIVSDKLQDDKIDKKNIVVEYRGGKDMAYSDATTLGRDLCNRVMVTMYVEFKEDIDSDKDGVFDSMDICGGTPRESKVDKYGCPVDSDKDGVIDYKDKCPNTAVGISVDKKGCPLDSDGDGVADYKDRCANTSKEFHVDLHGCPVNKTLALTFKRNSSEIFKSGYVKIVEFAEFLKQNPSYKVEIIGHTDSVGKAESNMILSSARAEAVKDALVEQGIKESRLSFKGRGELEPLMSNRTPEGRKMNRRIEIKLKY
jgi:outer membrane protein OmpA-like peptidoglycan-associated protein